VGAARARRLLPGILVDAVALADAGWRAVTVSRGSLATLARIHTAADALPRLRGDGVAAAAALLAALAEALIGDAARGAPARGTAGAPRAARRVARRARDDA
jgi:hypothetical protein